MFPRTLLAIFIIPIIVLAYANITEAKGPLRKSATASNSLSFTWFDANRIGAWITNEGEFASFRKTGNAGMEWPRDSSFTIIFQSGIWIAGLVDSLPRTAAAYYATEFRGGTYESYPDNKDDPRFRIYALDRLSGPGELDWDRWPASDGAALLTQTVSLSYLAIRLTGQCSTTPIAQLMIDHSKLIRSVSRCE